MNVDTLNHPSKDSESFVTSIISAVVNPKHMAVYEKWIEKINIEASKSVGFFSVDVIKPKDYKQPEYVVILKFASYQHLKGWFTSESCKKLMSESKNYIVHMTDEQQSTGMEIWFSRDDNQRYFPQPKYYKRVLMGLLVVYPLSTIIGLLISPLTSTLPPALQTFVIIAIMSCLMTWPVMPYLTRWLNSWLYPKP